MLLFVYNNIIITNILLSLCNYNKKYIYTISNNFYFANKYIFKSLIRVFSLILKKAKLYILSTIVLIYKKNSCLNIYIALF